MQKVITLSVIADGSNPVNFTDAPEVNKLLDDGYKVVSVTAGGGTKGYYSAFVLLLEKSTAQSFH